jgi:hypothetical protein
MNIYQKLIEVRKAVPYLQKEDKGAQYAYVGSSKVLSNVRSKMDELGLLLVPAVIGTKVSESVVEYIEKDKYGNEKPKKTTTYFTELTLEMTWINAENPEEQIKVPWYGQGVDIAGEKGVGKALTYAEKYFLLKQFNIATDKDDPDSLKQFNIATDKDDPDSFQQDTSKLPQHYTDKTEPKGNYQKISESQAKRLFALSNGNKELVKSVIEKYNYKYTKEISTHDYETIAKEIETLAKKAS